MQRLFDIVFSGIGLVLLSPLLLPLMIILRVTGEGEIFFLQSRVGLRGKHFKLYKFATMLKNSPNIGTGTVTLMDDPRVLPVGRFLRKSKINELPQLFNVLKGDMSLVGPRPQTQRCFEAFPERIHDKLLSVRPGLSGLGSIVFRDEESMLHNSNEAERLYDEVIMPYKGALEESYVNQNSLVTYFILLFATVWLLVTKKIPMHWPVFAKMPSIPPELREYIFK